MLRALIALALLLSLSCSGKDSPVAHSSFDEQAGSVDGASAAKAKATAQSADLLISIPASNTNPDTAVIAGRIHTSNYLSVTEDSSSVEIPDQSDRAILMVFYKATGGGSAWTGDNWGSVLRIGAIVVHTKPSVGFGDRS